MRKLTGVLLLIGILLLAGCSASKPESTVESFIESGKAFDTVQMASLLNPSDSGINDQLTEALGKENDSRNQFQKYFLDYFKGNAAKITYTVKESKIEKNDAVVTIDFKYIDGGPVLKTTLQDVFSKAYLAAQNDTPMQNEEIGQMLVSSMQKNIEVNNATFTSKSLSIKLVKVDKTWYISELNEDLLDVFLSNYLTVSKEFAKEMNSSAASSDNVITKAVGDEIILKTIKLKVNAAEEKQAITSPSNTVINAAGGMKFVVIYAEVTNTTSETFTFPPNLIIVDDSGRQFKSYLNTTSVIDDYLDYKQLPPGITQTGKWIYELPTDAASYSLYVKKSGTNELYAILLK